jgi:hypothetical protein
MTIQERAWPAIEALAIVAGFLLAVPLTIGLYVLLFFAL